MRMRAHGGGGAIAAGHPQSARAGADVLAAGGNACDALIAAVAASWVAEPTVSSPCGGGFLVYRDGPTGRVTLLDFFVAEPGVGFAGTATAMESFDVEFGTATQRFHIGVGSCGVPGTTAGLGEAHRRFGSQPWGDLLRRAIDLARTGVVITKAHARLHAILVPVVTATPAARAVFAPDGRILDTGEMMRQPALAATLERLADAGAADIYHGALADSISAFFADAGSSLTRHDLASYRVIARRPVRVRYRDYQLATTAPPSSGGILLAYALAVHHRFPPCSDPLAAGTVRRHAEILREAEARRGGAFARRLARGGARSLLGADAVWAGAARVAAALDGPPVISTPRPAARGTTHVSVIDAAGNAASMTSSTGCGSGVFVADTGLHMNNMLGEDDLTGHGRPRPGQRLTSMMTPTVLEGADGTLVVVGSSGSARIRSSMHRLICAIVDSHLDPRDAVDLPRVHVTADGLDCEYGFPDATLDAVSERGERVIRWPDQNIYFGGAQVVTRRGGRLAAAGDPRRGGDAIAVDGS